MNSLLTIVLPVRIDCRERLDNLKAVLTWIDKMEYPLFCWKPTEVLRQTP